MRGRWATSCVSWRRSNETPGRSQGGYQSALHEGRTVSRLQGIQYRMLLTALLPVTLVAVLLAVTFLSGRVGDNAQAQSQRERTLARQVAALSEFGVFSANTAGLQVVANSALREPDVRAVVIRAASGTVLASAGKPSSMASAAGAADPVLDRVVEPITASLVPLDDLFNPGNRAGARPQVLGQVLIEFSREAQQERARELLLAGVLVTLAGLVFGGLLALGLGRGVVLPILRVSREIERIGQGDFTPPPPVPRNDPLHGVQQALGTMALRLAAGRDDLERRVAAATSELREKKDEAEAATRAKSRFLAAASHDLRQPTHALGMFVARLAQLPHDAGSAQLVAHLEASVRAMQDLLDSLLDISKLDAGAVPVLRRPVPLQAVLNQVRDALDQPALQKGLRLRVRPSPVWVISDPALLYRIVLNLVSNAICYTPRGSVLLAARVSANGQLVRLQVRDSGIGIAPEHQAHVFLEFFQLHNPQRDRTQGLGLGLNIVQRTAGLLQAPLSLRSGLGCGSCFSVELPVVPAPVAGAAEPASDLAAPGSLSGLAVLVVEDDALAREALGSLLQSWGCQVRSANGLDAALAELDRGGPVQVIVSDYRLRDGENGIDLVQCLRERSGSAIAACLMSGDTDVALIVRARAAGLTLLHKPVRPAKLRSLIRRLAAAEPA